MPRSSSKTNERDPFLVRLAESLGMNANAGAVFGSPIERDGVTVVPVARARYGFGGGGGSREEQQGFGGGGGLIVSPVGYIELKAGGARFRPIRYPLLLGPLIASTGALTFVAARAIYRTVQHRLSSANHP